MVCVFQGKFQPYKFKLAPYKIKSFSFDRMTTLPNLLFGQLKKIFVSITHQGNHILTTHIMSWASELIEFYLVITKLMNYYTFIKENQYNVN